jgi:hypothetical protein
MKKYIVIERWVESVLALIGIFVINNALEKIDNLLDENSFNMDNE